MREGIHRDGRHLYPAFPYTHFARTSRRRPAGALCLSDGAVAGARRDAAERAGVSVQPAPADGGMERAVPPGRRHSRPTRRNRRSGIAAPIWSRVSAIAAPAIRRAMRWARKGERLSRRRLCRGLGSAGADVAVARADPVERGRALRLFADGRVRLHGVAAGPMAPVVKELAALPDTDIRAMAVYLASFNKTSMDRAAQDALAARLESSTGTRASAASSVGARIYQGACAVCHEVGGAPLFGSRPSMALNSNLHSAAPDNLIQVILHGIANAGRNRSRLYAGLQGQPDRRPGRGTGDLSQAAIRPGPACLDRYPGGGGPDPAGIAR